jgi:hypothetical protein
MTRTRVRPESISESWNSLRAPHLFPLTECAGPSEHAGKLYLALFATVYIPVPAHVIGYPSHADTESAEPASPREPTMPDR